MFFTTFAYSSSFFARAKVTGWAKADTNLKVTVTNLKLTAKSHPIAGVIPHDYSGGLPSLQLLCCVM